MNHRLQRVQELIKRELSDIIQRHIRFDGVIVTINEVDITPDLKQAHVFISALGGTGETMNYQSIIAKLESNRKMLQHEMSKRVVIKYTPHLHFKFDNTAERATRIFTILEELDVPEEPVSEDDEDEDRQHS
ncbi:MAG TPA: 30S ribosome-binding factor RbfA [Chthoniobacterales bacterium]|jgi:ribosome-binding factor A